MKSTDGTLINVFDFSRIEKFKYDVAVVTKVILTDKNEYEKFLGLINSTGDLVFSTSYRKIKVLNKKYVAVTKEKDDNYGFFAKYALYDINGNLLVPYICRYIERVQTNIFDISFDIQDSRRYINREYFTNNCISTRNGCCIIRFDFKKGIPNFLNEKIALDVRELRKGQEYVGKITKCKSYGLFVEIENVGTGLLHISELKELDQDILDFFEDDIVNVKILDIDIPKNRFTLTLNTESTSIL